MSDMVSKKNELSFLPQPMPERIYSMDGGIRKLAMISVGVCLRTTDNGGRKIIPTKEVLFAIGPENDPMASTFSVPASMAKAIRDRLDEFIKACEAPVTSRETAHIIHDES